MNPPLTIHRAHRDELLKLAEVSEELRTARQHIKEFIYALDRGYLDCKDDSAFIDALRAESLK